MAKTKIDWSGDIRNRILQAIKERGVGGFATVRSVYYYLGSLDLIPMTQGNISHQNISKYHEPMPSH